MNESMTKIKSKNKWKDTEDAVKSEEERMRNCLSPRKKREWISMNEKEQEQGEKTEGNAQDFVREQTCNIKDE